MSISAISFLRGRLPISLPIGLRDQLECAAFTALLQTTENIVSLLFDRICRGQEKEVFPKRSAQWLKSTCIVGTHFGCTKVAHYLFGCKHHFSAVYLTAIREIIQCFRAAFPLAPATEMEQCIYELTQRRVRSMNREIYCAVSIFFSSQFDLSDFSKIYFSMRSVIKQLTADSLVKVKRSVKSIRFLFMHRVFCAGAITTSSLYLTHKICCWLKISRYKINIIIFLEMLYILSESVASHLVQDILPRISHDFESDRQLLAQWSNPDTHWGVELIYNSQFYAAFETWGYYIAGGKNIEELAEKLHIVATSLIYLLKDSTNANKNLAWKNVITRHMKKASSSTKEAFMRNDPTILQILYIICTCSTLECPIIVNSLKKKLVDLLKKDVSSNFSTFQQNLQLEELKVFKKHIQPEKTLLTSSFVTVVIRAVQKEGNYPIIN